MLFGKLRMLLSNASAEDGAAYVEYAVIAGVAIALILGSMEYFFGGIAEVFQRLGDAVRGIG